MDSDKRTLTLLSPQPNIKNKLLIVSDILFVDMKWCLYLYKLIKEKRNQDDCLKFILQFKK